MVSLTSRPLLHLQKLRYSQSRRLLGSQKLSGGLGKEKKRLLLLLTIDRRLLGHPVCRPDTTPTALPRHVTGLNFNTTF